MNFCDLEGQNDIEIKVWWHSQIKLKMGKFTHKPKSFDLHNLHGQKGQALTSPCGIWSNYFSRINLNVVQYTLFFSGFFTSCKYCSPTKDWSFKQPPRISKSVHKHWSCPQDSLHVLPHDSIQNYIQMDAEMNLCWKIFDEARTGDRPKLGKPGWLQCSSFPFPTENYWLYLPVQKNLLFYHWTCDWPKTNFLKSSQKMNFRL